ncbi:hypothetical protein [Paraburkholderia sp. BCC1886]|uniref:hypothetical protein n=1 Tax=Paraburkholderia sp. BCC1886 TaxID=2562670 RepID=UPI00118369E6|nr:hypothetical protein [Paraburkholderia sp. BCC1886]
MTATKHTARWWKRSDLVFELNSSAVAGEPGSVLVGLGNPNPGATSGGISLNHKGYASAAHPSVSAFIRHADDALIEYWRTRVADTSAIRKIVVEDFSLDTCFALLLFGARLDGVALDDMDRNAWLSYVSAWESGTYLDGERLEQSAACLLSALGHSYVPEEVTETVSNGFVAQGMLACLNLLETMCASHADPLGGIGVLNSRDYARAVGQLAHERQMYELALKRARRCQLLADLGGTQRRVVLDALFLTEGFASGVLKVMARTDTVNTWTHRGFGLLAVHRPGERGTGNDMVISVDPVTGAHLGTLWKRLEELENARWGATRPHDAPRWLESYVDPDDAARLLPGAPNQPWYDDGGRYTLIAAPKWVAHDQSGTKLDWRADVIPALWEIAFVEPVRKLVERIDDTQAKTGNVRRIARFRRQEAATGDDPLQPDRVILETPTFHAWLARQSMQETLVESPFSLPESGRYEVEHFGGVTAVFHRQGVTFYSSDGETVALDHFLKLAARVAEASSAYDRFLHEYADKLAAWTAELLDASDERNDKTSEAGRQTGDDAARRPVQKRDLARWSEDMVRTKASALAALSDATLLEADYDHNQLAERLQRMWGLSEQRADLLQLIDRVDELMRQVIAARTERRQRIYGGFLSAAGLGIAASHVWEPVKAMLTTSTYEWQLKLFGEVPRPDHETLQRIAEQSAHYELVTVMIVAGFSVMGFLLYYLFGIRGESE